MQKNCLGVFSHPEKSKLEFYKDSKNRKSRVTFERQEMDKNFIDRKIKIRVKKSIRDIIFHPARPHSGENRLSAGIGYSRKSA
jgi:hypothetical protein